ncbi:MAG: 50S ribosomal protein L17 [Dehalococcoidia bacterium]|nr:50S ribosomal protein L17 [Dehalococcoidia bacterium]
MAGRKLNRPTGHRMSLFRNQVTDLFRHEKIRTTEAKAKEVKGLAEKIVTLGKRGDLHARRRALAFVRDRDTVEKVFSILATRYQSRLGGYTRIVKLRPRMGDGAPMVLLELMP